MVFWKKKESGASNVELRVQELVQRLNVVDWGSQLHHQYKLYNFAGHSLKCWLITIMLTTFCRKKKVETCPLVYRLGWAANFKLTYPI